MGNCTCSSYNNNSTPSQKCININELSSISPINRSMDVIINESKSRNKESNHFSSYGKSTEHFSKEFSFEMKMLKEINLVRTNPKEYALKLKDLIKNIINEGDFEYLIAYSYGFNKKILLKNGSKIFLDTIDYLNNLEPLHQLQYCEEIKIQFNKKIFDNDDYILNKKNIENLLINQRIQILKNYKKCAFNIDNVPDPILSIVFQITDDLFEQERRNIILNKDFSNFAVNTLKGLENSFISILSFA